MSENGNAPQTNTEGASEQEQTQQTELGLSNPPEPEKQEAAKEEDVSDVLYPEKKDESSESDDEKPSEEKEEPKPDEESEEKKEEEKSEESKEDKKEDESELVLKAPEDSKLNEADMERITSYAKENGLSKEAAQKLVENESEARDEYFDSLQEQHKQMIGKWQDQCKLDKEIGGDNFSKNIELARRVAHKFGTQEFLADLDSSGYGNHPEVVRTFARIGRAMSNDELVRPGAGPKVERPMEDLFYGDQKQS